MGYSIATGYVNWSLCESFNFLCAIEVLFQSLVNNAYSRESIPASYVESCMLLLIMIVVVMFFDPGLCYVKANTSPPVNCSAYDAHVLPEKSAGEKFSRAHQEYRR